MKKKYLLFIAALFWGIILFSCSLTMEESSGLVKYEVICNPNGFKVSYIDGSGKLAIKTISSGYWSITFNGEEDDVVGIIATADNKNANIAAKIYYNGNIIEQESGFGDKAEADVSGILP